MQYQTILNYCCPSYSYHSKLSLIWKRVPAISGARRFLSPVMILRALLKILSLDAEVAGILKKYFFASLATVGNFSCLVFHQISGSLYSLLLLFTKTVRFPSSLYFFYSSSYMSSSCPAPSSSANVSLTPPCAMPPCAIVLLSISCKKP